MYKKIEITELRKADIIVTTGDGAASVTIRNATGSSVSHAILYLGNNEVLEAVGSGVERRSWEVSKTVDGKVTLAIAIRRRGMNETDRQKVVDEALKFEKLPYDMTGAVGSGMFGDRRGAAIGATGCTLSPVLCLYGAVKIAENAKPENADKAFFCSELVARSFEIAGFPLVDGRATWQTPGALRYAPNVDYVGHLIDTPLPNPNITEKEREQNRKSGYRKDN